MYELSNCTCRSGACANRYCQAVGTTSSFSLSPLFQIVVKQKRQNKSVFKVPNAAEFEGNRSSKLPNFEPDVLLLYRSAKFLRLPINLSMRREEMNNYL